MLVIRFITLYNKKRKKKKVGMSLSDYVRPDKSIGIIGGGSYGLLLVLKAKMMGFSVNVLDPAKNCPAHKACDHLLVADYNDIFEIERLSRMSDVLIYTTNQLNLDLISSINESLSLPQGIDILALTKDELMMRGFLEDHGINVAPYATIVRITDVEENIDGIGYPCRLKETRGKKEMTIEGASDIVAAMSMVKQSTCILESIIPSSKTYSLSLARNHHEEVMYFPIVETIYDYDGLKYTTTLVDLDVDLMDELERIARVIIDAVDLKGLLTIEYSVTSYGAIYVKSLSPFPTEEILYSMDSCEIDGFEAHLRGVCNWPLVDYTRLLSDAITTFVQGRDLSAVMRHIPQQPHWHFHFYDREDALSTTKVAHITVLNNELASFNEELEKIMM